MMCDKCVKKNVCRLCDGSNIQGCIEFYRPHEKVLQEIRQEVNDEFLRCDANAWSDVAKGLLSARCIIDKKIKELSE